MFNSNTHAKMKKLLFTLLIAVLSTSAFSGAYETRAWQRISVNLNTQETATTPITLEIKTTNTGEIISTTLVKSSENPSFDRAVIAAVNQTQVLPKDVDGHVKNLKLTVNSNKELIDADALLNEQSIKEQREQQARQAAWAKETKRLATLPGVYIGQTANSVLTNSSWGKPNKVNRSIYASGNHEQWVYGHGDYLYFTNGVLTSIQTRR